LIEIKDVGRVVNSVPRINDGVLMITISFDNGDVFSYGFKNKEDWVRRCKEWVNDNARG
jgi:hypothetical protein